MDSFEIKALFDKKQYMEISQMYERDNEVAAWSQWDYFYYAQSLRKLKRYGHSHQICQEGLVKYPDFEHIKNVYCWSLYYLYVRDFNTQEEPNINFHKAVDSIIQYSAFNIYSPYERTLWKYLDYLKNRKNCQKAAAEMNKYLDYLPSEALSDQEAVFQTSDGKEQKAASPLEKWYSLKSKALLEQADYTECIALCQKALHHLSRFHHGNRLWFTYRIALAEQKLGYGEKAEKRLQGLLKYKKHWLIYQSLFEIYRDKGKTAIAIAYASEAMLSKEKYAVKVNLLEAMARLLRKEKQEEASYWHILLAKHVRETNGWNICIELKQNLDSYAFITLNTYQLQQNLQRFWRSHIETE